jgi:hypothetical protein
LCEKNQQEFIIFFLLKGIIFFFSSSKSMLTVFFSLSFAVSKIPYGQLPLQLLIKRDMRDPNETAGTGLPVNIVNGSINFDMGKMMAAGGLQVPGSGLMDGGSGGSGGGGTQNGWGLWNIVKDAAAAVTPSGAAPQGGFGDLNGGGGGMMTNGGGGQAALGYSPDLKLPDGKRLAYR